MVGLLVGVLGVVLTVAFFVHERSRDPQYVPGKPIRAREKQRTIAVWTIGRFFQSLQQFDKYCDRLRSRNYAKADPDPTKPSRSDLQRFAEAVLLTAAVDILPFSQGKANLFHFADPGKGDSRKIVSQVFIGPFPPSQVLGGGRTFREMRIKRDEQAASVAGECVQLRRPRLRSVKSMKASSGEELGLGTTHILGIPAHFDTAIGVDDFCRVPQGMPAAITVDLRIAWLARPLLPIVRRLAYRRSKYICHRLGAHSTDAAGTGQEDG